jgi:uncharacterized membrane protein
MAVAGVAWAIYTLVGRRTSDPIAANARSFLWSTPLAMLLVAVGRVPVHATARGIVLAVVSGAIASGLGYAVWYRVLPRLTVTQAAVAQLSVPVIAAVGAVLTLGETVSLRLVFAGVAVLSGVGLVLSARSRRVGRWCGDAGAGCAKLDARRATGRRPYAGIACLPRTSYPVPVLDTRNSARRRYASDRRRTSRYLEVKRWKS